MPWLKNKNKSLINKIYISYNSRKLTTSLVVFFYKESVK